MSGIIIINRRALLLPVATSPDIYGALPTHCQSKIDVIGAKAEADTTAQDIETLAALILVAVHC